MDQVRLPLIRGNEPFGAIVERMRVANAAAVVRRTGQRFYVHGLGELLARQQSRRGWARDVQSEASLWRGAPTTFESGRGLLQTFFDTTAFNYLILEVRDADALVVTRSEDMMRAIARAVVVCTCQRNGRHVFDPTDVLSPGTCNQCPGSLNCN